VATLSSKQRDNLTSFKIPCQYQHWLGLATRYSDSQLQPPKMSCSPTDRHSQSATDLSSGKLSRCQDRRSRQQLNLTKVQASCLPTHKTVCVCAVVACNRITDRTCCGWHGAHCCFKTVLKQHQLHQGHSNCHANRCQTTASTTLACHTPILDC
jgi:hypothetical protein